MRADLRDYYSRLLAGGYVAHLFMIAGFILAFFLVARLMSEKRAPANTFAWCLAILFIPYLGVPLFLLFGGRKLRRMAERKTPLLPALAPALRGPTPHAGGPVAHTVMAAGGCPPVTGNHMQLLPTGEEEYATLEQHILSARHTIHITTFILGRDDTGRRIVNLLAKRAKEGVKVRLLLDALGCLTTRAAFVDPLRAAGGEIGRFMPVLPISSRRSANLRNHRKLAIFDHNIAIIGGRNLAHEYMGPTAYRKRWRDLGTLVEGPAATLLNEIFIADWCFATRQSPEAFHADVLNEVVESRGKAELQVVASGPDVRGDPLYEGIIAMIQEAERSIWIVTPYFIPDDVLLRSLMVKARAGREVTLIVPAHSNHPVADYARRHYTQELRRAGGRVLLYHAGMMHSKAMVVDDRIGLFGSANFDLRSLFVNFEVGVVVHSVADVRVMKAWIDELTTHCVDAPIRISQRGVLSGLAEDLSRLLAPLL
jgi:cardiolipin synthase A/B